jgi:hypothetical protein
MYRGVDVYPNKTLQMLCCIYLFTAYLTTLSVTETEERRMTRRLMNNRFEKMRKVFTFIEISSRQSPATVKEIQQLP